MSHAITSVSAVSGSVSAVSGSVSVAPDVSVVVAPEVSVVVPVPDVPVSVVAPEVSVVVPVPDVPVSVVAPEVVPLLLVPSSSLQAGVSAMRAPLKSIKTKNLNRIVCRMNGFLAAKGLRRGGWPQVGVCARSRTIRVLWVRRCLLLCLLVFRENTYVHDLSVKKGVCA
jgi:hypothetical protein